MRTRKRKGMKCEASLNKVCDTRSIKNIDYGERASVGDSPQESGRAWLVVPDEILMMLFDHLSLQDRFRMSLVSRQWRRCALLILPELKVLLQGCSETFKITVSDGSTFGLKASGYRESTALLRRFRESKIARVTFELYHEFFSKVLVCLLTEIAKKASRVDVHKKKGVGRLTDFFSVCKVLGPHITHLYFNTNDDLTRISADTLHDFLVNLSKLKTIGGPIMSLFTFQDMVLSDCFPRLEEADIQDMCYDLFSVIASWQVFVDRFKNQLRRLAITQRTWSVICPEEDPTMDICFFVRLEYLDYSRNLCSLCQLRHLMVFLRDLPNACPRLTTLRLTLTGRIETANAIVYLFKAIGKFKQLQTLDIRVEVLVREMCNEFCFVRALQVVAAANNFQGRVNICNCNYSFLGVCCKLLSHHENERGQTINVSRKSMKYRVSRHVEGNNVLIETENYI